MALTIDSKTASDPRALHLALTGDLDADGARVVRRALETHFASGRLDVTIDLDRVGFVDSSGLASLIVALRRARERGGDIRVATANPRIRRVLEVTALAKVFKLGPPARVAA